MGLGLGMFEGGAGPHDDWSLLVLRRADCPALGTGLLGAQVAGLFLGGNFEGPSQQGLDGCHGDVFHIAEGYIQSGALFTPMLPDDDFSPAFGQFFDVGEILRGQLVCVHAASLQQDE